MPRIPTLKPKEVISKLEKLGFIQYRQKGSHVMMYNPSNSKKTTIPVHRKDIPKGTLNAILKQVGIDRDTFIKA